MEAHDLDEEIAARQAMLRDRPNPSLEQWLAVTPQHTFDLLASFQHAVIHELLTAAPPPRPNPSARAASSFPAASPATAGLRTAARAANLPYPVIFPSAGLSTDNAAMIAAAAFPKLERGDFSALDIGAHANLPLA